MRKVTTVNLNGRAYQLEDSAYEKLQAYLHQAEATLAGNPDRAEVMIDIEQAIADKCERVLERGKNVVTTKQLSDILEQMGEVEDSNEAAADEAHTAKDSAKTKGKASAEPESSTKRLFVVREGSMILGVAQGIGAYLGVDANLVRIVFIILTFVTSGFWILVYILLGVILPSAKTEAELAEAYGKPVTAQDIVERARERVPDSESLKRFSDAAMRVLRLTAKITSIALYSIFGIITSVWILVLGQLMMGNLDFRDQLAVLNGWHSWVAVTAVYAAVSIPIIGIARLLYRCSEERPQATNVAVETGFGLAWGLAVTALIMLGVGYGHTFADYVDQHQGYLDIGDSHICVDSTRCDTNNPEYRFGPESEQEPEFRFESQQQ